MTRRNFFWDACFVLLLHALRRNIGLTSCSCGIPQMHMLYCVLYVFRQSQVHKLLLWDGSDAYFALSWYACRQSLVHEMLLWYRPAACAVLCFTALKQCQANELLLLVHSRCMSCVVLCTHWGNVRLTKCFCGIAQMYVSYAVCTNWINDVFCRIAQMHVLYCVLHELSHHQANELLLRDHPDACVV